MKQYEDGLISFKKTNKSPKYIKYIGIVVIFNKKFCLE